MMTTTKILVAVGILLQTWVQAENLVFILTGNGLFKAVVPEDDSSFEFDRVLITERIPRQIAYDPIGQKIYYTEVIAGKIVRCDLNGRNRESYEFSGQMRLPSGIALDYKKQIIYFLNDFGGVWQLAIEDFTQAGSAINIPDPDLTAPFGLSSNFLAFSSETASLYATHKSFTQTWVTKYVNSEIRSSMLFSPGLPELLGVAVNENAQELFVSKSMDIIKFDLRDMTDAATYTGAGSLGSSGLSLYKEFLYYFDNSIPSIKKISQSLRGTPIAVPFTLDGSVPTSDTFFDINFYIECLSNLVVTENSASSISLAWDTCQNNLFQITYEAINSDQCSRASVPPVTLDWQSENVATIENLKPYSTYKVTVLEGSRYPDTETVIPGVSIDINVNTIEHVPSAHPSEVKLNISQFSAVFSWSEIPCGSRAGVIQSYTYMLTNEDQVIYSSVTDKMFAVIDHEELFNDLPCGVITFGVAGNTAAGTGSVFGTYDYQLIPEEPFNYGAGIFLTNIESTTAIISWTPSRCTLSEFTVTYTMRSLDQCQDATSSMLQGSVRTSPVTLFGLTPGSLYEVEVSSFTLDNNLRTITRTFTTLQTKPTGTPTNLQNYKHGASSALLVWDKIPCESRNGVITSYHYNVFAGGNVIKSGSTPYLSIELTDLPCGVVNFQVAGQNEAGVSDMFADIAFEMISSDPFQPGTGIEVISVTTTTASAVWTNSRCPTLPLTITLVLLNLEQCRNSNTITSKYENIEPSISLTDLSPGSKYRLTVEGKTTSNNTVSLVKELTTKDAAPLAQPTNVHLNSSSDASLTFEWSDVSCGQRGGLLSYEANLIQPSADNIPSNQQMSTTRVTVTGNLVSSQRVSSTRVTISGLTPDTSYLFQVAAVTSGGFKNSDLISSRTKKEGSAFTFVLAIGLPIAIIVSLAIFILFIYHRQRNLGTSVGVSETKPKAIEETHSLSSVSSPWGINQRHIWTTW